MQKINTLVVTYNRLSLLKENLSALEAQTYPIARILIIDNCSTDGTAEYLKQFEGNSKYLVIRTEKNIGGAGGFSLGLRRSVELGCDGTWLMDDDTIPTPTALEELVSGGNLSDNLGFCCSCVVNTAGDSNTLNKPHFQDVFKSHTTAQGESDVYRCTGCTFVSALFTTAAVEKLGLPIKDFFIWGDDIEYTLRISKSGMECLYVPSSVAVHKSNTSPTIETAPVESAWRFYYLMRNTSYIVRLRKRFLLTYYIAVLNKYRRFVRHLNRRTDGPEVRARFAKELRRGMRDAFTFNPKIEFVQSAEH